METADIIRSLQARGLTQVELARRTSIPQPRLSKWAQGRVPKVVGDALRLHALWAELQAEAQPPAANDAAVAGAAAGAAACQPASDQAA